MLNKTELLSPAGDMECLRAAVFGGCDAVYLGGSRFNARGNASNFDNDNIKKAVNFCRLFGVAVHITLNTLAYDKNIHEILDYVSFLESEVVPDAYIVQDIGLMKLIHERYPDAPIHASTQCAIHSSGGVEFFEELGVRRIVCAREMTQKDITELSKHIETEMFIHGALCVSQSGGCLFSSMVAKNSGNQGKCAQPCRLPFKSKNEYPLSLKDLSLANRFVEVLGCGATSFKIEGRMKDPQYVFGVTSVFRKLIDERRNATKEEISFLGDLFTRSGFTTDYFHGQRSRKMFGRRTQEDKDRTAKVSLEIKKRNVVVDASCVIASGLPVSLTFSVGDVAATVFGTIPERAQTAPSDKDSVLKQISRLGATDFSLGNVCLDIEKGLYVSPSELNKLRREAIEKLEKMIIEANTPKRCGRVPAAIRKGESVDAEKYDVFRIFSPYVPRGLDESMARYIDVPIENEVVWSRFRPDKLRLILPRVILLEDEEQIKLLIKKAKGFGVSNIIVQSISHKQYCDGFDVHASLSPAPTNSESMRLLASHFKTIELSPEMTENAILRLEKPTGLEVVVYGRIPLMHTMTCIIESMSCRDCGRMRDGVCTAKLIDRTGAYFPMIREFSHRTLIFNSCPTYLLDKTDRLDKCGVGGRIHIFTDEKDFGEIDAPTKFTRGYF